MCVTSGVYVEKVSCGRGLEMIRMYDVLFLVVVEGVNNLRGG